MIAAFRMAIRSYAPAGPFPTSTRQAGFSKTGWTHVCPDLVGPRRRPHLEHRAGLAYVPLDNRMRIYSTTVRGLIRSRRPHRYPTVGAVAEWDHHSAARSRKIGTVI
jgi:hypothetical protein